MYENPFEMKEVRTLKEIIKEKVGSQRNLSKLTGIKEATIRSWVNGRRMPTLDNAFIAAKALDIDLNTLAESLGINISGLPSDSITSQ